MPFVKYQKSSHQDVMMLKRYKEKDITPTDNGFGYKIVSLSTDGKRKNHYVHRLVAEAFIPNPNGFSEVNHIDYDKANNEQSNLEWVSRKENINWSKHRMLHPKTNGKKTNLGMRYVSTRDGKYRVNIRVPRLGYKFDKSFETLDEAIAAKEAFILGKEYFAG